MKNRIYFFKDYLVEKYGHPLYRVPLDLSFGCPHKNKLSSGCIFCAEDGAKAVHLQKKLNIKEQIEEGIQYVRKRYDRTANEFIAYLQTYTNTYANIDKLKKSYEEILSSANFKLFIISTRPDCLSNEVLEYLSVLNEKIDLYLEIGVQSANEKTLQIINRKHDFYIVEKVVKQLHQLKIKTIAHIIIGLPNETLNDYITTIKKISILPLSGIKIHNLLILKGSTLGKLYSQHAEIKNNLINIGGEISIPLFNEYEYAGILVTLLRLIPKNIPILRLIADAPEEKILSPKWTLTKGRILELVQNIMAEHNYIQGDLSNCHASEIDFTIPVNSHLKIKTEDNSYTFYHPIYKELYHSKAGAKSEAYFKFVLPSDIPSRLKLKNTLSILDIGFGLGYNAMTALKEIKNYNGIAKITSLEKDNNSLYLARSLYEENSLEQKILSNLLNNQNWTDGTNLIKLIMGDAREKVSSLTENFDLIFLDAFSTQKNPELWTFDFIKLLKNRLENDGAIISYSSAYSVKGAMLKNKLYLGVTEPFGRKNGGTIASLNKEKIKTPISKKDISIILKSTAGVPFRDHGLKNMPSHILQYRNKLVHKLRLKGIPKWIS